MINVKRHLIIPLLSLFILIIGCNSGKQLISLQKLKPTVLKENGAERFHYWEFNNTSLLWDTNFISPLHIKLYRDSINYLLGSDFTQSLIKKIALQDELYQSIPTLNGDSINAQLIHSKVIGIIRPTNYLEAELLDYQLNRYPLFSHPTEFHGFILLHDSLKLVKVYFAASDQPWPPKPNIILSALENDLKQGWTFKYHLHNHYEPKTNNYIGILAPSMTDAQFYLFLSEDFNLKNAIITNGYNTVEIKKEEFQKLKSPE